MTNYENERVDSAKRAIKEFRNRLSEIPDEKRTSEALIEIAAQLIEMNASIDLLEVAVQRVGDNTV